MANRPLQVGMKETFDWIARTEEQKEPVPFPKEFLLAGIALVATLIVIIAWLTSRDPEA